MVTVAKPTSPLPSTTGPAPEPPPRPSPAVRVSPEVLAEKSERLGVLEKRLRSVGKDVFELEKKGPKKRAKLEETRALQARMDHEASALRAELSRARLYEADRAHRAPEGLEEYRRYAAERLGVPASEVSPDLARWLQAKEQQAVSAASSKLEGLRAKGPITTREDAKRYFQDTYAAIGKLAKDHGAEKKRRDGWSKANGERWALAELPKGALLQGYGPDSPVVRWATTAAEKNSGPEVRDLVFRLRSTALNGLSGEHDGTEKRLVDVFSEAEYAQALAGEAIRTVEVEASARLFDLVKRERGVIELAAGAEGTLRGARERLRELWTSGPKAGPGARP